MEKRIKKRNRKDSVSITKIYETIRDKGFMQELWLEVMSDVKHKPSYIGMKNMVRNVIESSVDNYATKPKDHEQRLKTRTIFTDLSIMTYTIDTLICELLHKKLKDEFKTIISNIVDELQNMPESSHVEQSSNPVQMLEGIGEMLRNGVEKESTNETAETMSMAMGRTEDKSNCETLDISFIKTENISPRADEHSVDFPDPDTIAFSIVETESMSDMNYSRRNVTTNLMSCLSSPNKGSPKKVHKKKKKVKKNEYNQSSVLSYDDSSDVDVVNVSDGGMSDDSSFSFRSVSSVNTSDLSSFEDTISISSEDELGVKTKRYVPFKDALALYTNGNIEDLREMSRRKDNMHSPDSSTSVNNSHESPKRLPARIRKPNSKYSSEDVICSIRNINQTDSSPVSSKTDKSDAKKISIVSHPESSKRRGRPAKNKNNETETNMVSMAIKDKRIDNNVSLSSIPSFTQTLISRKRGRPPKNTPQALPNKNKILNKPSNSMENSHSKLLLNQSALLNSKQQETMYKSEPENKRKRGRPPSDNKGASNNEYFKHTVESFTSLEERLSVKDQVPLSPSKSSTKSYETSDLYKPRSDFRGCFDSRRNTMAITLFSN